jgi:hypothetical protein
MVKEVLDTWAKNSMYDDLTINEAAHEKYKDTTPLSRSS